MTNTIAQFQFSTEEDLHFQLKFLGLPLAGRTLKANVKHRSSGAVKTELTLANGGLTLVGTDNLTALFSKGGMVAWPTGEYQADIRDETGGSSLRIMAVRFVYDEPGKLVYGVRGNQATVNWGGNQAVVTAIGGVGPPGPANTLSVPSGGVETVAPDQPAEVAITGSAPAQEVRFKIPRGLTGDQGPAGTLTIDEVFTGAPGSAVVITNTGTAENAVLDITIPQGDDGATGDKGWSPVLAVVTDSVRRVLQVADWAGGEGTKPATGQFLGASGLVSDIASAVDIRGAQGVSGSVTDGEKGDIVVSESGTAWTIKDDAVTFAKAQNVASARILGRATASAGNIEELTGDQATALLSAVVGDSGSGGTKGLVPAPAAGDAARVLSGAGTWIAAGGAFPRGHIAGLGLANNAGTAATHIDISPGECRDGANTENLVLASVLTKRLDQNWAVGSGNGWLDTGTAVDGTYHVHLIKRPDTLVVDSVASLSATAPNMTAAGLVPYTKLRRIGSIIRLGGVILAFVQDGDLFSLNASVLDLNGASNFGTGALTRALTVPAGIRVQAQLRVSLIWTHASLAAAMLVSDLATAAEAASVTNSQVVAAAINSAIGASGQAFVMTNTSREVRYQTSQNGTNLFATIRTTGWIDARGRA